MKTTIYNYENEQIEIDIKNVNEIFLIIVKKISGDDFIEVIYKNGTKKDFDSCDCRTMDFLDDEYIVPKKNIKKWLNWKPKKIIYSSLENNVYKIFEERKRLYGKK